MEDEKIKNIVREGYSKIASSNNGCGCGCSNVTTNKEISKAIGYSNDDLYSVPEGSNLGLGCGNPIALASLKEGETVLDLGSGAGFDAFLAANRVGKSGKVIGVDMTPAMISKARENALCENYENVEFRLGELEHLPVSDNTIDIIISNCVINLVPDKIQVFKEAFRVLKPGGRIMISDIILTKELPDFIRNSLISYIGCVSGAILKEEYIQKVKDTGFRQVKIEEETKFSLDFIINNQEILDFVEKNNIPSEKIKDIADNILSIRLSAIK